MMVFLHSKVGYARHAMSIDERRSAFPRVIWGRANAPYDRGQRVLPMLEQRWFAGNHADIGGGYPESESRLSDIALEWMVDAAANPALGDHRLQIDERHLQLNGDPLSVLHDETRSSIFRWAKKEDRSTQVETKLHYSVFARLSADAVQQYDVMTKYRPEALRHHPSAAHFYAGVPSPRNTCDVPLREFISKAVVVALQAIVSVINRVMLFMNQSGRFDSVVSCLGLLCLIIFWGFAGWTLVFWQVYPWLKEATWHSYPLAYFFKPSSQWLGVEIIIDWIFYLPTTLVSGVGGLLLFVILNRLSSKLYLHRAPAKMFDATKP
jgi:hypothetical protein